MPPRRWMLVSLTLAACSSARPGEATTPGVTPPRADAPSDTAAGAPAERAAAAPAEPAPAGPAPAPPPTSAAPPAPAVATKTGIPAVDELPPDARCDRAHYQDCRGLALKLHLEHGPPAEVARLYQVGCDGGDGDACAIAGDAARFGRGRADDQRAARRNYQRACDLGTCLPLAGYLLDADDRATQRRGVALLERLCAAHDADACWSRADVAANHDDAPGAVPWYQRGCALSDQRACAKLDAR